MDFTNAIQTKNNTILITIYLTPAAKKNCFPTGYNKWRKTLDMTVKAKPVNNQANIQVIKEFSQFFNLPLSKITIAKGQASREKTIALQEITKQQVIQQLQEHLHE